MKTIFLTLVILGACASAAPVVSAQPLTLTSAPQITMNTTVQTITVTGHGWTAPPPSIGGMLYNPSGVGLAVTVQYASPTTFTFKATFGSIGSWKLQIKQRGSSSNVLTLKVVAPPPPPPPPQLAITSCPAPAAKQSPDGNPVPVTFALATTSGGTGQVIVTPDHAVGSLFPVGSTLVTEKAVDQATPPQSQSCQMTVVVTPPPPPVIPPIQISCPAPTSASTTGTSAVVPFPLATATGGQNPTVVAVPASGSTFPVGTSQVVQTASDNAGSTPQSCTSLVIVNQTTPGTSPDGTTIPPATQITDANGSHWTIGVNAAILKDGSQAAGGLGSEILWYSGSIYVLGTDSNWYQWNGSGWTFLGSNPPGPVKPPPPPPPPQDSGAVTGPDPIEPRYVANTAMARVKTPQQQMHYTAGLPIRFMADSGNPAIWWCPPGHPPYVCGHHVDFLVDGAIVGTQYDSDPAEQATGWQLILANGLPVGDHILTVVFTAHDPTAGTDYPPVTGLVPITIHVDPMPTHGTVLNLTQDIVLSGNTPLNWTDTTVIGNGHAVTAAAGYSGAVTISNSFITGLANYNAYGIDITTTGDCDQESSIYEATAAMRLNCANVKLGAKNEFRSSNTVQLALSNPDMTPIIDLTASVSGTAIGFNSALGIVKLSGPVKWQVGGLGPNDGVVIMGPRGVLQMNSSSCQVQGLYDHHDYQGAWSQGFNFEGNGQDSMLSCLVEHSLLRGGSWLVQSFANEMRFSVLIDDGAHATVRTPLANTRFHHNIFNYVAGPNSGFSGMIQDYKGYGGFEFFNNNFDAGGSFANYNNSVVRMAPGPASKRFNSNVVQGFSEVDPSATPIGSVAGASNGLLSADYNLWNNPLITTTPHYSTGLVTPGGHEKTGDPLFAFTMDSPYVVDEGLIWTRQLSIWTVLNYYRKKYTPQSTSPLLFSGDPADGPSNPIGAIGACDATDQLGRLNVTDPCAPTPPSIPVQTMNPHPRLLITPAALATWKTKAAANDPDWVNTKAQADSLLTMTVAPDQNTCPANAICAGYAGGDWSGAVQTLGLAYLVTGNVAYAKQGLAVVAVMNTSGLAVVQSDSGYPTRNVTVGLSIGYDWLYSQMDAPTKAATWAALNAQFDWAKASAFDWSQATASSAVGNYFGGHEQGFFYAALATAGDNPRAAEILTYTRAKWDAIIVPAFSTGGLFEGGHPYEGFVYGTNGFNRLLMTAYGVKTATNEDLAGTMAQRIGQHLIYALRPNRWQWGDEADYAGNDVAIMDQTLLLLVSYFSVAPENGYVQWMFNHMAPTPNPFNQGTPAAITRFMWFNPNAIATDVSGLPLCKWSPVDAHLFCRTSWKDDAIWTSARLSAIYASGHQARAAGNIEYQRGNDTLLLNGGQCKGPTTGCTYGDPQVMDGRSWRINGLDYQDPWSTDYQGAQGDWGVNNILGHQETNTFGWGCADLTSAYTNTIPSGLKSFKRCVVTLLPTGEMVVYSHIEAANTTDRKSLNYHLNPLGTPSVTGQTMTTTVGSSTFWMEAVTPPTVSLSVHDDPLSATDPTRMTYRLEAEDKSGVSIVDDVTVLAGFASSGQPPAVTSLGNLSVQVGTRTVTFAADASNVVVK